MEGADRRPGRSGHLRAGRLDHALAAAPGHRELRPYYRAWLALLRTHPALGTACKSYTRAAMDRGVLTLARQAATGERVVLLANLEPAPRPLPPLAPGVPRPVSMRPSGTLSQMSAPWDPIDHLLALDPGRRGIGAFFAPGAADAAARALRRARRVLITTGFTVAAGAPETDGPPGAAVLGHALGQLGARVRYVIDPVNVPILKAALSVLGAPADVVVYPEGEGVAPALLRRERPTHMIAIERPGRTRDGDYLNARGASVAAWNRPIDELFLWCREGAGRARAPRVTTIGVGDGGNEIGMGNVRARLRRLGPLMARIAAVVATDHLVVSGVSNWGAYGIAAALGRLTGRALLHTPEAERRMIEACAAAGAVDGLSRRREATVDALGLDVHLAFVRLLRVAAEPGAAAPSGIMSASPRASPRTGQRPPRKASMA